MSYFFALKIISSAWFKSIWKSKCWVCRKPPSKDGTLHKIPTAETKMFTADTDIEWYLYIYIMYCILFFELQAECVPVECFCRWVFMSITWSFGFWRFPSHWECSDESLAVSRQVSFHQLQTQTIIIHYCLCWKPLKIPTFALLSPGSLNQRESTSLRLTLWNSEVHWKQPFLKWRCRDLETHSLPLWDWANVSP